MIGKRWIIGCWIVAMGGCLMACAPQAVREAEDVVAQADNLWHAGKQYGVDEGDSATLAQAYKTLEAIPLPFREGMGLGSPMGNISYATLFLNTCHSNSTGSRLGNIRIGNRRIPGTSATLVGSKETIMQSFRNNFNFNSIRGTSAGFSYARYLQSEPQFFFQSWTYFNKH